MEEVGLALLTRVEPFWWSGLLSFQLPADLERFTALHNPRGPESAGTHGVQGQAGVLLEELASDSAGLPFPFSSLDY